MDNELAIKLENVSKVYKLYNDPVDRLKEAIHPFRKKYHKDFYALDNISFDIKKGETVGIIGKNGSGKSTLLKIITGVLTPTQGTVNVCGKISALLELGAGFNPEYTGLENIYLNGTIMGYTKEEMDERLESILLFADIGEFIYQPVKTYSSGMFVRLAFSVAINIDPEILIIDEALSVGDMRFQQKCWRKIEEFSKSRTVLFVTHDIGVINKFCNKVIWINDGAIIDIGDAQEIGKKYQAFMIGSTLTKHSIKEEKRFSKYMEDLDSKIENLDILGDNRAQIIGVGLYNNKSGEKLSIVSAGELVTLMVKVRYNYPINNIIIGFTVKERLGTIVAQTNSYIIEEDIGTSKSGQISTYYFEFTIPNLNNGIYTISPAVASGVQDDHTQHSWVHDAVVFQIFNNLKYSLQGYLFLDNVKFGQII